MKGQNSRSLNTLSIYSCSYNILPEQEHCHEPNTHRKIIPTQIIHPEKSYLHQSGRPKIMPSERSEAQNNTLVIRVRYGADGAPTMGATGPFRRPESLNGLVRGVFFGIPCPCPRSRFRLTHTPDGSPLKIGRNKRGPCRE